MISGIERLLMELRLLQYDNPRYRNVLKDDFADGHPNYLNPPFRCYNLECRTCTAMEMARNFTERCYASQHEESTLEASIGEFGNSL